MPQPIVAFVKVVDALNYRVGRFAMYLIFVLAAILLASTVSRLIFGAPVNWALEMAQFILSAYYLLGGAYALQHGRAMSAWTSSTTGCRPGSARMTDAVTILFVIFYLVVLFWGGMSSHRTTPSSTSSRTTRPGRRCSGRSRSS